VVVPHDSYTKRAVVVTSSGSIPLNKSMYSLLYLHCSFCSTKSRSASSNAPSRKSRGRFVWYGYFVDDVA